MPAKRSISPTKRKPTAEPSKPATETSMTAEQAARLKQLSVDAYEPDAFKQILTQAEAARRIATLSAKLELLDGPPHTL
jgi:hypothetical protein